MNEEPRDAEEAKAPLGEQQEYSKPERPYSNLPFNLKLEDLSQEGVQKMLLGEISRLDARVIELSDFESRFHENDKDCAVFKAKEQRDTMLEILYTVAIAVGAALLGWLPSSSSAGGTIAIVVMALALFIFALLAKWKGGKNES